MMRFRHRLIPLGLVAALVATVHPLAQTDAVSEVSESKYMAHVKYLASDDLAGRGNGTPGLERAAEYIAEQFRNAGLAPGLGSSWFQPFRIVTGLEVGDGNRLAIETERGETAFELGRTYVPLSVSADVAATAGAAATLPLVFAGYGITAAALHYDDYDGVDVRGKAILILTHEPQENDDKSPFDGRDFTQHASLMQKAMTARERGARLVLLVTDPSHDADSGKYAGWLRDPQADDYGIAVLRVERDRLERVLGPSLDLEATARAIDGDLKPRSRGLPGISVETLERFAKVRREVRNVIGVLPGADAARAKEAVVIGAHYDHLGLGGRHSMAPDATGEVHNGADDNASGTAALIEMARTITAAQVQPPRTLVFIAFAAEELGLLGSAWYVDHPVVPLEQTTAMVNLDMIGRPAGRILVSGVESAPSLDGDVKAASAGRRVAVKAFREGAGVGSSDDTTFLLRRVPAIGFFSGFHADYHRPSDDWDKIDATGATEVTRLAVALVERIAARSERPAFVEPPVQPRMTSTGDGRGYGPYFGSVPDFADSGTGVRFADVRNGSPAAKAGFRRGDVLVRFGGAPIANIQDFTYQLRKRRPGDTVEVIVLREGKEVAAEVTLVPRQ
jgi:peptidase M28-like protein/PDZ domain-containing protein